MELMLMLAFIFLMLTGVLNTYNGAQDVQLAQKAGAVPVQTILQLTGAVMLILAGGLGAYHGLRA